MLAVCLSIFIINNVQIYINLADDSSIISLVLRTSDDSCNLTCRISSDKIPEFDIHIASSTSITRSKIVDQFKTCELRGLKWSIFPT
jgi:hypothetical protein